ncbi:hypothetical protein [Thiomicrorhabdus sp.]|uniref:hypothetical protein n=1 Tax=Thiomicrorhabdus sp. TaxID=2039724 RepID=UPI002AA6E9FB|nr:hypothetical protein [Thiomicrorhabdus sp.]
MKIKYFPEPSKDNQYVQNTINAIETAFKTKVEIASSLKSVIKRPKLLFDQKKSDLLIINWLENHLRSPNNGLSILGIFKYFLYLLYFRLISKKTIYVRHNIYPHNMKGFHAKLATFITNIGENLCHKKIAHSGHLIKEGYDYVPHPLYNLSLSNEYKSSYDNYYTMFGRIERYKKIETIIKNWDLEETLLIAGSIGDQSYLDELLKLSVGKNIQFDARFIPDNEAANLVSASNGIILAHSEENMIVSGSFFFAITLGVSVFAIKNPFFNWLEKEGFKGLIVFDETSAMIKQLKINTSHPTKKAIQHKAVQIFGQETVKEKWLEALLVSCSEDNRDE